MQKDAALRRKPSSTALLRCEDCQSCVAPVSFPEVAALVAKKLDELGVGGFQRSVAGIDARGGLGLGRARITQDESLSIAIKRC